MGHGGHVIKTWATENLETSHFGIKMDEFLNIWYYKTKDIEKHDRQIHIDWPKVLTNTTVRVPANSTELDLWEIFSSNKHIF